MPRLVKRERSEHGRLAANERADGVRGPGPFGPARDRPRLERCLAVAEDELVLTASLDEWLEVRAEQVEQEHAPHAGG